MFTPSAVFSVNSAHVAGITCRSSQYICPVSHRDLHSGLMCAQRLAQHNNFLAHFRRRQISHRLQMDTYAAFASEVDSAIGGPSSAVTPTNPAHSGPGAVAPYNGDAADDLYASITSKEDNVLNVIRRLDDTRREEALRSSDRIAPIVDAFGKGITRFLARLVHYSSAGAYDEVAGLIKSPDGLVYTGVLVTLVALVVAFVA